jgi:hypothetical protein
VCIPAALDIWKEGFALIASCSLFISVQTTRVKIKKQVEGLRQQWQTMKAAKSKDDPKNRRGSAPLIGGERVDRFFPSFLFSTPRTTYYRAGKRAKEYRQIALELKERTIVGMRPNEAFHRLHILFPTAPESVAREIIKVSHHTSLWCFMLTTIGLSP